MGPALSIERQISSAVPSWIPAAKGCSTSYGLANLDPPRISRLKGEGRQRGRQTAFKASGEEPTGNRFGNVRHRQLLWANPLPEHGRR